MRNNEKYKNELLLKPSDEAYSMFPIRFPNLWSFYKTSQQALWSAEELDFEEDKKHWRDKLTTTSVTSSNTSWRFSRTLTASSTRI